MGVKYDENKIRYDLIPPECLKSIADVYTFGSVKYGDNNWQTLPDFYNRYYSALMRHLEADRMGEKYDEESGRLHLSHAAWNAIALLFNALKLEKGYDNNERKEMIQAAQEEV